MKQKLIALGKKAFWSLFSGIRRVFQFLLSKMPRKYAIAASAVLIVVACYWVFHLGTYAVWSVYSAKVEFVMEGREKIMRDGISVYEVYTSEGLFTNQDSLTRFKRDSDRLQNELRLGNTYNCKAQGFRFRAYELQPNLISCDLVTDRELADQG